MDADEDSYDFGGLLEEPKGYRPPSPDLNKVEYVSYKRRKYGPSFEPEDGEEEIKVGLVGSKHALWGHVLYPAALALSRFLELHSPVLLRNRNVLELGAGGGLPGLVAALEGARKTLVTDYDDPVLVRNLEGNVEREVRGRGKQASVMGYTWGAGTKELLAELAVAAEADGERTEATASRFDLILLSDIVFNHSQHKALLSCCSALLSSSLSPSPSPPLPHLQLPACDLSSSLPPSLLAQEPAILCFFSHHRPHYQEADLNFLKLAEEQGWECRKVWEDPEAGPAFPEDGGDEQVRGTVHGWIITRKAA